ncbi:MAG TPA: response regulator transcription factor [Bacteroidales bacterium]|nr:response regulator transcription factor [Bacteroidales bacterium]
MVDLIIVDDNPGFIEAVEMFLSRKKGYSVLGTANNGMELINHPSLHKADVILMDCEMPGMNGIETAKYVNHSFPYKKMIAVTMFDDRRDLLELLGAGFNGYIHKPDISSKLESVIERVLNNEYVFDDKRNVPLK